MSETPNDDGSFVLLASYPKSGNTWVRATLTAYLAHDDFDLGQLIAAPILCSRQHFDDLTGLTSADLALDEVDLARPSFHAAMSELHEAPWFVKVHDGWYRNGEGIPIFARNSCRGAVCIVRHPAAVLWSFAHHRQHEPASVVEFMANADAVHDWWPDAIDTRLPQRLFSWSEHVTGWLDQTELPILCVRYEDLIADPVGSIANILGFAEIAVDEVRLEQAVAATSFDRLQALEADAGFRERPASKSPFFRSGRADAWRDHIPPALRDRIAHDHGVVMTRLGYAA